MKFNLLAFWNVLSDLKGDWFANPEYLKECRGYFRVGSPPVKYHMLNIGHCYTSWAEIKGSKLSSRGPKVKGFPASRHSPSPPGTPWIEKKRARFLAYHAPTACHCLIDPPLHTIQKRKKQRIRTPTEATFFPGNKTFWFIVYPRSYTNISLDSDIL